MSKRKALAIFAVVYAIVSGALAVIATEIAYNVLAVMLSAPIYIGGAYLSFKVLGALLNTIAPKKPKKKEQITLEC